MLTFHIITLFPESFSYLDASIIGRAAREKKIAVKFYNPRDYADDSRRSADGRPYGGGPGMVMLADPILRAVKKAVGRNKKAKIFLFATDGKQFAQDRARKLSKSKQDIVLIAGRYEGIDERVAKILKAEKISIGPFVLSGGELPAMTMIDTIARHIPGVLGKGESIEENRTASPVSYARPEVLVHDGKKYRVPKILLSGNHARIEEWKKKQRQHGIGEP